MQPSEFQVLRATLNSAFDAFENALTTENLPSPSIQTCKPHPLDDPAFLPSQALYEARRTALATMGALTAIIQSPHVAVASSALGALDAACVRLAAQAGISDILAALDDPDEGMPVVLLAERIGANPIKLERIMRLLVNEGYYRETRVGVFANNRLSNLIKKGTQGYYVHDYFTELGCRMSVEFPNQILNPNSAFRDSTDPRHSAFNLAYATDKPLMGENGWVVSHPEETAGFGAAMGALASTSDAGVLGGIAWDLLAKDKDAIIDIGAGQGTLLCSLAAKYPNLPPLIAQDLPATRHVAEAYIASKGLSERIKFEVQNFFEPQARGGKNVYIIQRVMHDWSTEDNVKILGHLRECLKTGGSLFIIESLIRPGVIASVPGGFLAHRHNDDSTTVYTPSDPPPLIPEDFGAAHRWQHQVNVSMTAVCNSGDFTLPELLEIVELAGLRIKTIHPTMAWPTSIIEVVSS